MSSKPIRIALAALLLAFGGTCAAAALTLGKSFGAASIPLNSTTTLTFVISNPNNARTNVTFTDSFPAGLVLADTNFTDNGACFSRSITGLAGDTSISVTVGTVPSNALCSITMHVMATSAGVKVNTTGPVSSTEEGVGGTATATLNVDAPPTVSTSFVLSPVLVAQPSGLQYLIANPASNPDTLTGVGLSDTLATGIHVNNASASVCGGTVTLTNPSSIALSGGSIAPGTSCNFTITIRTDAPGHYTVATSVTSTEGGSASPSSASFDVEGPASIATAFSPATIGTGATSGLTFTIDNPAANPLALTGVGFTDTLPAGLAVASASATVCGGTLTTTSPSAIALSGATIAAGAQCQFTVTVTGTASGVYTNTTSTVASSNGGAGNSATSSLTVASAPSVATSFGAASIPLNATTSLTLAITNPNAGVALTGVAFTDTLPAGLVIATPPGVTDTCGGAVTATAGTGSLSLSGGTLAAGSGCTVAVNVQGTSTGIKNNSVSVSSTEAGSGNTASATLNVVSTSFTGSTPHGAATASFTGGGATCSYASAAFIPLIGGPGSPPAGSAPAQLDFPDGLFDFTVTGCTPGSTITMTITYPNSIAGAKYWKYGPEASNHAPHWYVMPAAISGNTATFSITDGGTGDDDFTADGVISDPGGPGLGGAAGVPTLSWWMLALLALGFGAVAWRVDRSRTA